MTGTSFNYTLLSIDTDIIIIWPLLHNSCLLTKLTSLLSLSVNLPCTLIAISQDCEDHIPLHFCLSSSRKMYVVVSVLSDL